jgi:hypothetical protein
MSDLGLLSLWPRLAARAHIEDQPARRLCRPRGYAELCQRRLKIDPLAAFNAWDSGDTLTSLRFTAREPVPTIAKIIWTTMRFRPG